MIYKIILSIHDDDDDDKGSCKVILAPPQLPSKPNKNLERKTSKLNTYRSEITEVRAPRRARIQPILCASQISLFSAALCHTRPRLWKYLSY